MSLLGRILAAAVPPTAGGAADVTAAPRSAEEIAHALRSARADLRHAFAERERLTRELQEKCAVVTRLEGIIAEETLAASRAREADEAAIGAARDAALSGQAGADATALRRATRARAAAQEARLRAEGARAGLPEARQHEWTARGAAKNAELAIREAITRLVALHAEPWLQELEVIEARREELLTQVRPLQVVLERRWGEAHAFRSVLVAHEGFTSRLAPLSDADRAASERATSRWLDFAKRLASNPDATL